MLHSKTIFFATLTALVLLTQVPVAQATPFTVTFAGTASSGNPIAASALFDSSGSTLSLTLTNIGSMDVVDASEILTGVVFNLNGSPVLMPVSAFLSPGSHVLFGPDGGGNVGGEWGYDGSNGYLIGSSSAGGLSHPDFNGANLQGPGSLGGLDYGITSALDNPSTGTNQVSGNFALIQNSVTFQLSGLGSNFDSSNAVSYVGFQYGNSIYDACTGLPCSGPPTALPTGDNTVPEPGTIVLLGTGLIGLAIWKRRSPTAGGGTTSV